MDLLPTERMVGRAHKRKDASRRSPIKQIEIGAMRQLALISAAELAERAATERAAIEQIEKDVTAGARNGYGVILLKTNSSNLCVVASDKREAQALLILKNADKLTFDMHVGPVLAAKSAEDAFVGAKKAQCGAVYASAADLKALSEGLNRDKVPFAFSSLWITPSEIDAKDAEVAEKRRIEAQRLSAPRHAKSRTSPAICRGARATFLRRTCNSAVSSSARSSTSLERARLTRLLRVPISISQIVAASS